MRGVAPTGVCAAPSLPQVLCVDGLGQEVGDNSDLYLTITAGLCK